MQGQKSIGTEVSFFMCISFFDCRQNPNRLHDNKYREDDASDFVFWHPDSAVRMSRSRHSCLLVGGPDYIYFRDQCFFQGEIFLIQHVFVI